MPLDNQGVLMTCSSCGTTNRLRYDGLERARYGAASARSRCTRRRPRSKCKAKRYSMRPSRDRRFQWWWTSGGMVRSLPDDGAELDKAARELAGRALVLKVDTDANPELSERFGIRSIPTLGVFRNGREVNRVSGVQSATGIAALATRRSAVNS